MNEITIKEQLPKFLLHFFLTNAFWLIPAVWLCIGHGGGALILVSLLLTYLYASWCVYTKTKFLGITIKPIYILWAYTVCVGGFIFLTGYSTYQGLVSAYGISGLDKKMVCFLIAFIVALTLLTITLMIKVRKAPDTIAGLIFLYILFDALTGLPANFLFFYENAQQGSEIKFNKEKIPPMITRCQAAITAMQSDARRTSITHQSLHDLQDQKDLKDNQKYKDYLDKSGADTTATGKTVHNQLLWRMLPAKTKTTQPAVDTALSNANVNDSLATHWLVSLGQAEATGERLRTINDADLSAKMADSIRDRLSVVIASSGLPALQSLTDSLRTKQPNSIETLKLLYRFLGSRFNGSNDDAVIKAEGYDKDTAENIWMSLSTSVIIDILPLLFSLVYVKYKFND